jgi:hypothetical protein
MTPQAQYLKPMHSLQMILQMVIPSKRLCAVGLRARERIRRDVNRFQMSDEVDFALEDCGATAVLPFTFLGHECAV